MQHSVQSWSNLLFFKRGRRLSYKLFFPTSKPNRSADITHLTTSHLWTCGTWKRFYYGIVIGWLSFNKNRKDKDLGQSNNTQKGRETEVPSGSKSTWTNLVVVKKLSPVSFEKRQSWLEEKSWQRKIEDRFSDIYQTYEAAAVPALLTQLELDMKFAIQAAKEDLVSLMVLFFLM